MAVGLCAARLLTTRRGGPFLDFLSGSVAAILALAVAGSGCIDLVDMPGLAWDNFGSQESLFTSLI